jgi:hypothetical protein
MLFFRPQILAFLVMAIFSSAQARAGFEKIRGDFQGTDTASATSSLPFTQDYTGPTTASVKSKKKGSLGTLILRGINENVPGQTYVCTIYFNADGKLKADAIVPGVLKAPATGTWKSRKHGRKIAFSLSGSYAGGTYDGKGTVTGNGQILTVELDVTGEAASDDEPDSATFVFHGAK